MAYDKRFRENVSQFIDNGHSIRKAAVVLVYEKHWEWLKKQMRKILPLLNDFLVALCGCF